MFASVQYCNWADVNSEAILEYKQSFSGRISVKCIWGDCRQKGDIFYFFSPRLTVNFVLKQEDLRFRNLFCFLSCPAELSQIISQFTEIADKFPFDYKVYCVLCNRSFDRLISPSCGENANCMIFAHSVAAPNGLYQVWLEQYVWSVITYTLSVIVLQNY